MSRYHLVYVYYSIVLLSCCFYLSIVSVNVNATDNSNVNNSSVVTQTSTGDIVSTSTDSDGNVIHNAAAIGDVPSLLNIFSLLSSPTSDTTYDFSLLIEGDITSSTPLVTALKSNQTEFALALLDYCAPFNESSDHPCHVMINKEDMLNWTPLHWAAEKSTVAVAKLLLDLGANVDAVDSRGVSPISAAMQISNIDVAVLLFTSRSSNLSNEKIGGNLLHGSLRRKHSNHVRSLLKFGVNPNSLGKQMLSPVHVAAGVGDVESLSILLEHKANINLFDKNHLSSLHYALWHGQEDTALLLLSHGFNITATGAGGENALHVAVFRNLTKLVNHILDLGIDINAEDGRGYTPLHIASYVGLDTMVEKLLKVGSDVSLVSKKKKTALHLACECIWAGKERSSIPEIQVGASLRIVKHLINAGIDVESKDDDSKTSFKIAHESILSGCHEDVDVCYRLDEATEIINYLKNNHKEKEL